MPRAQEIFTEVQSATTKLIELGLTDDQTFPAMRNHPDSVVEVTFASRTGMSYVLKESSYVDLYYELKRNRDFNVSLLDGALVQIQYVFERDIISKHRLCYFPSPDLLDFQSDPDIYIADKMYAEVVRKSLVTFPFRIDFDRGAFVEFDHPMAHMSLGQYQNCRIPVRSAIGPYRFFDFILSSFYNVAYRRAEFIFRDAGLSFESTITNSESKCVHISFDAQRQNL